MLFALLLWSFGLSAALMQRAAAVADCEWYGDVNACIPVLNEASAVGDQYTQLTLELIVCLENNAEAFTGCKRDNPAYQQLCANVSVSDGGAGNNMCLPQSANLSSLSFSQAREMKSYVSCIGEASLECEQVRGGLYAFLGCSDCGDLANSAALVEGACTTVFGDDGSQADCAAAGAAAPTEDGRRVAANSTGIPVRDGPPSNESGVTVPLLGGPPEVRGATVGVPEAAAPAPVPAPVTAEEPAEVPAEEETEEAEMESSGELASPPPDDTIQQSRGERLTAAAAATAFAAAAACMLTL